MKQLLTIILFLSTISIYAFQIEIEVDLSKAKNQLKLSELTASITPIPLEEKSNYPLTVIYDVVITEDFIYLSIFSEIKDKKEYSVLQYDLKGRFISRIGETINSRYQIVYDYKKENIGLYAQKKITLFTNQGAKLESYPLAVNHLFNFKGSYYGITLSSKESRWTYEMNELFTQKKEKANSIFKLTDPSELPFPVGFEPTFSNGAKKALISFKVNNTIYQFDGNTMIKFIQFELKAPLINKPYYGQGIIGDWVFASFFDSRKGASLYSLTNSKSNDQYLFPVKISQLKVESGIVDDIFGSGFIIPTLGVLIQPEGSKMFYFIKKSDETQPEVNQGKRIVLFIAETK